jgi:hypothetical protein
VARDERQKRGAKRCSLVRTPAPGGATLARWSSGPVTGLLQHRRQEWNGKGSSNLEEWGGGENIRPGQRRHSMGHTPVCSCCDRQAA